MQQMCPRQLVPGESGRAGTPRVREMRLEGHREDFLDFCRQRRLVIFRWGQLLYGHLFHGNLLAYVSRHLGANRRGSTDSRTKRPDGEPSVLAASWARRRVENGRQLQ